MIRLVAAAACLAPLAVCPTVLGQFVGSAAPPGTQFSSNVKVSRQNQIVAVGISASAVAIWDPAAGVVLGATPAPGFSTIFPEALTADGTGLIGSMNVSGGTRAPFFWTPTAGTIDLTGLIAPASAQPRLSDVSVPSPGIPGALVGDLIVATPMGNAVQAFTLPIGVGPIVIGDLPGGPNSSIAVAVDASGQFTACDGNTASGPEAFRHDLATGALTPLGVLSTATSVSNAADISSDGSTVVGFSLDAAGLPKAFRWTAATGMVSLGTLPGGLFSFAMATNTDGSIVVGLGDDATGTTRAWIWTQRCGAMRDLQTEIITVYGQTNAAGWTLTSADGMSDTGFVAGIGTDPAGNTQVWTSQIARCWADFNGDGMLSPADIVAFNAAFLAGSLRADCDCDGLLTVADFTCFNAEFAAGCP
ncbi:MAG: hypothetical protein HRU13_02045 [Phycisphaerales bacterium]|nr:hypothetical protein [Phycisphaerales bacterium]